MSKTIRFPTKTMSSFTSCDSGENNDRRLNTTWLDAMEKVLLKAKGLETWTKEFRFCLKRPRSKSKMPREAQKVTQISGAGLHKVTVSGSQCGRGESCNELDNMATPPFHTTVTAIAGECRITGHSYLKTKSQNMPFHK